MLLGFNQGSKKEVFEKYVSPDSIRHDTLYSNSLLDDPESELNDLPIHELISLFSRPNDLESVEFILVTFE